MLAYLSTMPGEPVTLKDLSRHLKTKARDDFHELRETVDELVRAGVLDKDDRGRLTYQAKKARSQRAARLLGTYRMTRREGGVVLVDGTEERIHIAPRFAHTALHGDTVEVTPFARASSRRTRLSDERVEGEIAAVVERNTPTITGTLTISARFAFVVPDDEKFGRDVYVPKEEALKAHEGDKVVVRLHPWEDEHRNPEGEIIEVLGPAGDARVEVLSVARKFGLPAHFPDDVEKAAAALPARIGEEDLAGREDLRGVVCMTIDPEDAKDFDDAVSLEPLPRGGMRLGVHIADVSHFVGEGTPLDQEALERGTSVYMVNEVIPMLPERISNDLCSLRPNEDRLTYSVLADLRADATVERYRIVKSIIHSRRRFTYEEVQKILDAGKGEYARELGALWGVAEQLLAKRRKNGSLDFDTGEMKFRFDKQGLPMQIIKKTRQNSNRLIEECMLLANQIVAAHIGAKKRETEVRPFLYRVHDLPDPERIQDLANFVRQFGLSLDAKSGVSSRELQKLLDRVEGSELENVINEVALRAMAKAVYSEKNIGHYGLAFTHYTHFTSPIRRYPDLIVHRLLHAYEREIDGGTLDRYRRRLPDIARQSSDRERLAMEAERMSVRVMQVEYMKRHVGERFRGVIVGVTKFGLFVRISEFLVEGLVHISDLTDDYYLFDEKKYSLRGRSKGKVFRLGDEVQVRVLSVNPEAHQIQFLLA